MGKILPMPSGEGIYSGREIKYLPSLPKLDKRPLKSRSRLSDCAKHTILLLMSR